jgi:hypothetical protein
VRIGYAKLGRNIQFNQGKFGFQGDCEAPWLLERLALRNPEVEWVIVGKNTGDASYLPANVTNAWRPDVPRAPFIHKDGAHRCAFCKALAPHGHQFDCCDQGRYAWAYQGYVVELMGTLDGFVLHIGQHGNTHSPIPPSNKTWDSGDVTNTYAWARNYGRYLIEGLNLAGDYSDGQRPVVWLCADPRNYLKPRDLKWPTGANEILAQYEFERESKHERYRDPRAPDQCGVGFDAKTARNGELWIAHNRYVYSGMELIALPENWGTWGGRGFDERKQAGIATTAFWNEIGPETRRSWLVRNYLLEAFPDAELFGKWDDRSLTDLEEHHAVTRGKPRDFADQLGSWRVTVALPAPASKIQDTRWVTAKPWHCFAARTVCFLLGNTDAQGWILPVRHKPADEPEGLEQVADGLWSARHDWTEDELHLARWLRVDTPLEFQGRAFDAATRAETWEWLVQTQRHLLARRWNERRVETMIERRLGLR